MSKSGMSPEFEKKLEALAKDLHERGAIIPRNPNAERLPFAPYVEEVEANVAKTMADVLAEHEDCAFSASGVLVCVCGVALDPQEVMDDLSNLAAHQSAALTAAGYGLVSDAKREAAYRVGKRYAELHQMIRDELRAQAWDEALGQALDAGYLINWQEDRIRGANPYRKASNDDS